MYKQKQNKLRMFLVAILTLVSSSIFLSNSASAIKIESSYDVSGGATPGYKTGRMPGAYIKYGACDPTANPAEDAGKNRQDGKYYVDRSCVGQGIARNNFKVKVVFDPKRPMAESYTVEIPGEPVFPSDADFPVEDINGNPLPPTSGDDSRFVHSAVNAVVKYKADANAEPIDVYYSGGGNVKYPSSGNVVDTRLFVLINNKYEPIQTCTPAGACTPKVMGDVGFFSNRYQGPVDVVSGSTVTRHDINPGQTVFTDIPLKFNDTCYDVQSSSVKSAGSNITYVDGKGILTGSKTTTCIDRNGDDSVDQSWECSCGIMQDCNGDAIAGGDLYSNLNGSCAVATLMGEPVRSVAGPAITHTIEGGLHTAFLSRRENYDDGIGVPDNPMSLDKRKTIDLLPSKEVWIDVSDDTVIHEVSGVSFEVVPDGNVACVYANDIYDSRIWRVEKTVPANNDEVRDMKPDGTGGVLYEGYKGSGHCVRMPPPFKVYTPLSWGNMISKVCTDYSLGASQWVLPFTSVVVQCIEETMMGIFLPDAGKVIYQDSLGNACEAGNQGCYEIRPSTFFSDVQDNLQNIIRGVLALYIIIFGYKLLVGKEVPKRDEWMWLGLKLALVVYFAAGSGMTDLYPSLVSGTKNVSAIFLEAGLGLDEESADYKRLNDQVNSANDEARKAREEADKLRDSTIEGSIPYYEAIVNQKEQEFIAKQGEYNELRDAFFEDKQFLENMYDLYTQAKVLCEWGGACYGGIYSGSDDVYIGQTDPDALKSGKNMNTAVSLYNQYNNCVDTKGAANDSCITISQQIFDNLKDVKVNGQNVIEETFSDVAASPNQKAVLLVENYVNALATFANGSGNTNIKYIVKAIDDVTAKEFVDNTAAIDQAQADYDSAISQYGDYYEAAKALCDAGGICYGGVDGVAAGQVKNDSFTIDTINNSITKWNKYNQYTASLNQKNSAYADYSNAYNQMSYALNQRNSALSQLQSADSYYNQLSYSPHTCQSVDSQFNYNSSAIQDGYNHYQYQCATWGWIWPWHCNDYQYYDFALSCQNAHFNIQAKDQTYSSKHDIYLNKKQTSDSKYNTYQNKLSDYRTKLNAYKAINNNSTANPPNSLSYWNTKKSEYNAALAAVNNYGVENVKGGVSAINAANAALAAANALPEYEYVEYDEDTLALYKNALIADQQSKNAFDRYVENEYGPAMRAFNKAKQDLQDAKDEYNRLIETAGEKEEYYTQMSAQLNEMTTVGYNYCDFRRLAADGAYVIDGVDRSDVRLWDMIDCKLSKYLGIADDPHNTGNPRSLEVAAAAFISSGALGPLIGFPILVLTLIFVIFVGFIAIRVVQIYVMAFIGLSLIVFISPLAIPAVLFKFTNQVFTNWLKQLIAYILQPIILFASLAFMFYFIDMMYFGGNHKFVKDGMPVNYRIASGGASGEAAAIINAVNTPCDPLANDYETCSTDRYNAAGVADKYKDYKEYGDFKISNVLDEDGNVDDSVQTTYKDNMDCESKTGTEKKKCMFTLFSLYNGNDYFISKDGRETGSVYQEIEKLQIGDQNWEDSGFICVLFPEHCIASGLEQSLKSDAHYITSILNNDMVAARRDTREDSILRQRANANIANIDECSPRPQQCVNECRRQVYSCNDAPVNNYNEVKASIDAACGSNQGCKDARKHELFQAVDTNRCNEDVRSCYNGADITTFDIDGGYSKVSGVWESCVKPEDNGGRSLADICIAKTYDAIKPYFERKKQIYDYATCDNAECRNEAVDFYKSDSQYFSTDNASVNCDDNKAPGCIIQTVELRDSNGNGSLADSMGFTEVSFIDVNNDEGQPVSQAIWLIIGLLKLILICFITERLIQNAIAMSVSLTEAVGGGKGGAAGLSSIPNPSPTQIGKQMANTGRMAGKAALTAASPGARALGVATRPLRSAVYSMRPTMQGRHERESFGNKVVSAGRTIKSAMYAAPKIGVGAARRDYEMMAGKGRTTDDNGNPIIKDGSRWGSKSIEKGRNAMRATKEKNEAKREGMKERQASEKARIEEGKAYEKENRILKNKPNSNEAKVIKAKRANRQMLEHEARNKKPTDKEE